MERPGNLADPMLLSRHYPVANYSYPRHDNAAPYSARSSLTRSDRSSLGSEGSAPGLIDDRTDSEVSVDDDYQYHAHMAELWDSFWQSASRGKMEEPLVHPRKQYPAVLPSPCYHRKIRQPASDDKCTTWPLRNGSPRERNRKPAATYSAFPKPAPIYSAIPKPTALPPRTTSMAQARAGPPVPSSTPSRPPRPADELFTPCVRQRVAVPVLVTPGDLPPPSRTRNQRPCSPYVQRASKSLDEGSSRPMTGHSEIYTVASRSSTPPPRSGAEKLSTRAPRHYKSIAHLAPPQPQPQAQPIPEPRSVFEYDDSENEAEHGLSFFRFHKRSDSDNRRTPKPAAQEASAARPRRQRALTAPSSPMRQQPEKQETKRQGHDVLGRMLGRRSRYS